MKLAALFTLIMCISYVSTQEIMEMKSRQCYSNVCCRNEVEKLNKQNVELRKEIQELNEIVKNKNKFEQLYGKYGSSTTMATTKQCQMFGLGWKPFLRSCYYIGRYAVSWIDAAIRCALMGSTLAIITTSEENEFVISLAKKNGVSQSEGYWLDGSDIMREGFWIWSSTGTPITYQYWGENEPNDDSGEDCLEIKPTKNYTWNDEKCIYSHRQYICEKTV